MSGIPSEVVDSRHRRRSAPTLILWGEDDAAIPVHYAHEYGRLIPNSKVEVISDCGHVPQVEMPDATAALVKEFLGG
jgi:pimeloyl-ACP methyl ester carboxylesterase